MESWYPGGKCRVQGQLSHQKSDPLADCSFSFFFSFSLLCFSYLPIPLPCFLHSAKKISLKKNYSATHPHPYVLMYWNTDEDGHWTASPNPPSLCSVTDMESKPGAFLRMNPITQVRSPGCWRLRGESFPAPCF